MACLLPQPCKLFTFDRKWDDWVTTHPMIQSQLGVIKSIQIINVKIERLVLLIKLHLHEQRCGLVSLGLNLACQFGAELSLSTEPKFVFCFYLNLNWLVIQRNKIIKYSYKDKLMETTNSCAGEWKWSNSCFANSN